MSSYNKLDYCSDEVEKISYSKKSKRIVNIKEDDLFGWNFGNDPTVYGYIAKIVQQV